MQSEYEYCGQCRLLLVIADSDPQSRSLRIEIPDRVRDDIEYNRKMNIVLILVGKIFSWFSRATGMGSGSTWPGHIALETNKNFIKEVLAKNKHLKIILIAGTNGKTTTGKLIQAILEKNGGKVFQNEAGANLLNGIASSLLLHSLLNGKIMFDYAVFEVDENSLPLILNELTPDYLILLNIFRDQLDRYGETDIIANKWAKAITALPSSTSLILNADDPQIVFIGNSTKSKAYYFGLSNKTLNQTAHQHAVDSTYCPRCRNKLTYTTVYFSHLGDWSCSNCGLKRPGLARPGLYRDVPKDSSSHYPLDGVYNQYNTHAAVLFAKLNNINNSTIQQSLQSFSPAFGRQEKLTIEGKNVQIFLSKNPTSFNESLRTIIEKGGKNLLIVLNDQIPDGRDVSWIWDVDTEKLIKKDINIVISGDRAFDMGLRLKYSSSSKFQIEDNLREAIMVAFNQTQKSETLYVLPTYSAMLEVRKILTGKKIL